jgi:hypothetical protein
VSSLPVGRRSPAPRPGASPSTSPKLPGVAKASHHEARGPLAPVLLAIRQAGNALVRTQKRCHAALASRLRSCGIGRLCAVEARQRGVTLKGCTSRRLCRSGRVFRHAVIASEFSAKSMQTLLRLFAIASFAAISQFLHGHAFSIASFARSPKPSFIRSGRASM